MRNATMVQIHSGPPLKAGIAQLVEHRPSKPIVAGSNPVSRSRYANLGLCVGKNHRLAEEQGHYNLHFIIMPVWLLTQPLKT